jgi:phage N-6-adenine-methyltransferase
MVDAALFSSDSGEWETPQDLFDKLNDTYAFTVDVCASESNHKCGRYFTIKDDALTNCWGDNEICWMNPPYGKTIFQWMAKAHNEAVYGNNIVVCLVPARTDTKWWQTWIERYAYDVHFIKGRLKFGGARNSAPFPSALVIFRRPVPQLKHVLDGWKTKWRLSADYLPNDH